MIGIIGSLLILVRTIDSSNMDEFIFPGCLSLPPPPYPHLYTSFELETELRSEQQGLSVSQNTLREHQ